MESIILHSTYFNDKECKVLYDMIHKYLKRTKHDWKDNEFKVKIELIKE